MVWYALLCYLCFGMVWKVWYGMRFQCYAMRFLCYAMVYIEIDKHSATVHVQTFIYNSYHNSTISILHFIHILTNISNTRF